jgi:hypothetical protein
MRLYNLLLEANITNTNEIKSLLADIWTNELKNSQYLKEKPIIENWWKSSAYKWLVSSDANNKDIFQKNFKIVDKLDANSPEWLKIAINSGQTVYQFITNNELKSTLSHVIHFLNSLVKTAESTILPDEQFATEKRQRKNDAETYLKSINGKRMSFDDAVTASQTWFKSDPVPQEEVLDEPSAKIVYKFPDGFTWKFLTDNEALSREGKTMQHCVGENYSYPGLEENQEQIWSLRNPKNQPVGTMRLSISTTPPTVVELKGKQNRPMSPIYGKYGREVVKAKNLDVKFQYSGDYRSLGMLVIDDQVLTDKDFPKWMQQNNLNDIINVDSNEFSDQENYILGNYDQLTKEQIKRILDIYSDDFNISVYKHGLHDHNHLDLSPGLIKAATMYYMGIIPSEFRSELRSKMAKPFVNILPSLGSGKVYFSSTENGNLNLLNVEQLAGTQHFEKHQD